MPLRRIARELDRRGIATKLWGVGWSHTAVVRILERAGSPVPANTP